MPTSRPNHLSDLALTIVSLGPADVLDAGAGFGSKGVLFRELTDVWNGRVHPETWMVRIDAIEPFSAYLNPLHEYVYDHVYADPLPGWEPEQSYDFIYLGDVLEHMTQDDGVATVQKLASVCDKMIYIATPLVMRKQGAVHGNPMEAHVTQWNQDMLEGIEMPAVGHWEFRIYGNVLVAKWRLS